MQPNVSFSLFAQSAQQQTECPPAGASQEVNEAAPSLAAPSASGQQAGTPMYPGDCRLVLAKGSGPGMWNRWGRICGGQRYICSTNRQYGLGVCVQVAKRSARGRCGAL